MKTILFKRLSKLSSVVVGFAAVSSAKTEHSNPDHPISRFGGDYILTDKLVCHRNLQDTLGGEHTKPVVLVACGSFNPPTCAHMRVLEVVREEYMKRGIDVYGAYLSPVHNDYAKPGLVLGDHRLAMVNAAAEGSGMLLVRPCQVAYTSSLKRCFIDFVMADPWEFSQETYTRTLYVLDSIEQRLRMALGLSVRQKNLAEDQQYNTAGVRSVLVCGSDLIESMCDENAWDQSLLEQLLAHHGVACVVRPGSDLQQVLDREGTLPSKYKDSIMIVENNLLDDVSSTQVRERVRQGKSIQGLVPHGVASYIKEHHLYQE